MNLSKPVSKIDGTTRVLGLIGNPVAHTLSPEIHNTLASLCGRNLVYVPFPVEQGALARAVQGAYALHVLGLNVTVPYKRDVLLCLKEIDPLAETVESVNTLVSVPGGYRGYNTDMSGLFRAMTEDGVALQDEEVILLGAGGVGRAVAYLCAMKGAACVFLLNRSEEKAKAVAREVNAKIGRECVLGLSLEGYRTLPAKKYLAIQATSVGMFPRLDEAVIEDPAFYRLLHTGYDLIYRPGQTKFMRQCEQAGARAFNGLKMLVYQGVEAFELWNDTTVTKEQAQEINRMLSQRF